MNNYLQIRLTHWLSNLNVEAVFYDGASNDRRYYNVTPSSVKRLQNAVIKDIRAGEPFEVRVPINFEAIGWVAQRIG